MISTLTNEEVAESVEREAFRVDAGRLGQFFELLQEMTLREPSPARCTEGTYADRISSLGPR